ncbi:MAG: DUF2314 domain-containing protein [Chthoniobacteraceae bacterium]
MLAGTLVLSGCASQEPPHAIGRAVRRAGTEPECFCVEKDDAQMARAVRSARRHVGVFITALQHPGPGQRDFEVKKPFVKDGKVEHLWLSHVQYSGGRFHGLVDNRPQNITGIKMGQRVSVNPDEISDWSYVDDGKLVGGYTVRVLCSELSPERKQEFLKGANFRLEP